MAKLAAAQHGVVTRAQLREIGLGDDAINRRLRIGRLHLIHRSVFAVGHGDLSLEGRFLSAVFAVGRGAVLSHISAAILWGFWPRGQGIPSPIDVTVARRVRSRSGIRVHPVRALPPSDTTRRHRIPATTPARTLLDLADVVIVERQLKRAIHEAQVQRRVSHPQLLAQITRTNGRRAAARLAALTSDGPAPTRSELEDVTLELLTRHGFARPATNARVEDFPGRPEVDFLFAQQRVVIEVDGGRFHETRFAREQDARKQALLEAAGYRVVRLNWAQVTVHEHQTVRRLDRVLPRDG